VNSDFKDILSAFIAEAVEFLLVGAYALAAHGIPRSTGDIDLWVHCSSDNAGRVLSALARFGAPMAGISCQDFESPGIVFQIGVAPNRVDILTGIDGVHFEDAWSHRLEIDIEGMAVPVIGREHLIRNKRATGRPRDRVDAEALLALRPPG